MNLSAPFILRPVATLLLSLAILLLGTVSFGLLPVAQDEGGGEVHAAHPVGANSFATGATQIANEFAPTQNGLRLIPPPPPRCGP